MHTGRKGMEKQRMASAPKGKRRNSERRKEKSRDAARCRRSRESQIFYDLGQVLPISRAMCSQLDKASVMRLAISTLKVQSLFPPAGSEIPPERSLEPEIDRLYLEALQGFVVVVSAEGDLIYASENINQHLGLSQLDMMGHSVFDFAHPCDHSELKDVLSVRTEEQDTKETLSRSFFLRMKCTITTKGRNVNLKSATYKVIRYVGRLVGSAPPRCKIEAPSPSSTTEENMSTPSSPVPDMPTENSVIIPPTNGPWLIAIGEPIPHPSNVEINLDKQTFLSKHSLDMKFTYVDEKIGDFLGYSAKDLLGRSIYEMHHALDCNEIEQSYKTLFSKGQCETGHYRFLAKNGGYVWVQTQATLIYANNSQKPNSVVCVNFVISGVEHKEDIVSVRQVFKPLLPIPSATPDLTPVKPEVEEQSEKRKPCLVETKPEIDFEVPLVPDSVGRWQNSTDSKASTESLFHPRTEDMSQGYFVFHEDKAALTVQPDDNVDDLTHLAPTAGETSVALEVPWMTLDNDIFLDTEDCFLSDASNVFLDGNSSAGTVDRLLGSSVPNEPDVDPVTALLPSLDSSDCDSTGSRFDSGLGTNDEDCYDFSLSPQSKETFPLVGNDMMWGSSWNSTPVVKNENETSRPTKLEAQAPNLAHLLQTDVPVPMTTSLKNLTHSILGSWNGSCGVSSPVLGTTDNKPKKDGYFHPQNSSMPLSIVHKGEPPWREQTSQSAGPRRGSLSGAKRPLDYYGECATKRCRGETVSPTLSPLNRLNLDDSPVSSMSCTPSPPPLPPHQSYRGEIRPCPEKSVLFQLLVSGHDELSGYSCKRVLRGKEQPSNNSRSLISGNYSTNTARMLLNPSVGNMHLTRLSQQDCDVNAPVISNDNLLCGEELLVALGEAADTLNVCV